MTNSEGRSLDLPVHGAAAPPRTNGELLFAAPWQARLLGLTLDLVESGAFGWSDFQRQLIAAVRARAECEERAVHDAALSAGSGVADERSQAAVEHDYYLSWLGALEHLLGRRLLDPHALVALRQDLAKRPHGHDH